MKPRYKVATVSGYPMNISGRPGGKTKPGLSAHVLDTRNAHREVACFRSEERAIGLGRKPRGIANALTAAEDYAATLNAGCEPT